MSRMSYAAKRSHLYFLWPRPRLSKPLTRWVGVFRSLGIIQHIEPEANAKALRIYLKYIYGRPSGAVFQPRISGEGSRYVPCSVLTDFAKRGGGCVLVMSTRAGLKTQFDCIKHRLGGYICGVVFFNH